jgi:hypothetical protein
MTLHALNTLRIALGVLPALVSFPLAGRHGRGPRRFATPNSLTPGGWNGAIAASPASGPMLWSTASSSTRLS